MLPHERLAALRRIAILAPLSKEALVHVSQSCKWREYQPGEQILGHHDASTDVLFLLAGKARVILYSADGKAVLFQDLKPQTMFGEIAAIDRRPRSATVQALERCIIASMSANHFEDLIRRESGVAIVALRHLTADVRRLSERVFEFSTMVVQKRIQAELLRLARQASQSRGEAVLSPAPSLSDIAERISTHREAVSRELSRLTTLGLIRREHGKLRVIDVAKLARLVEDATGE